MVRVVPWDDPVVEASGIDPRSAYVEQFWLPVLGPTAVWLLRRIADRFDAEPNGFDLDLDRTAVGLGIGGPDSRHAPLRRALRRCARFRLVRPRGPGEVAVRRAVGPLPRRLLDRLPEDLRADHDRCERAERPPPGDGTARRRARLLALDLAAVGVPRPAVERRLLAWGVHPALAYESAAWASDRPSLAPPPSPPAP